ncbi:PEP-CTERM sorting domain-containing protein [Cerasicoccus maritimus]|uniref:PEP-CTERM sorting domain-containing protein n=1 Tax=Cerasicoccus maritimus TaxID=490089 RepID=UPI002852C7A2|nr:PEP-CTERM sorting domain-containing protein [Cerasicoccus maritimus]
MKIKLSIIASLAMPSLVMAQTILINYTNSSNTVTGQPETWNNYTGTPQGSSIANLVDINGSLTGISMETTNAFAGVNSSGTTSASAPYPSTATGTSFYDANDQWTNPGDAMGVLEFSGLDVNKTYSFTLYASRITSEDRSTLYTLQGANSGSDTLNPSDNVTNTVLISDIAPTAGGIITLTVTPGATNANSNDFIYLGVAEISAIPEPSTIALGMAGIAFVGSIYWRRRKA